MKSHTIQAKRSQPPGERLVAALHHGGQPVRWRAAVSGQLTLNEVERRAWWRDA
jgi:hypothetical protein